MNPMNNLSKVALSLCYGIMIYVAFIFYPKWEKSNTEATLSWDASGYYMYLPAFFIYNDAKSLHFKDGILEKYKPTPDFQQGYLDPKSGNYVFKYSSGQALTMSPFFFFGHLWAKNSSIYPPDGFSYPYQICIGIGMLLYAFLGLFFLRKVLLHFYKDSTVALVLIAYVVGSNYLNYGAIDQALTHNTLFTIYTLVIYATIQFYTSPTLLKATTIGLLTGLATLIRPTDIVSILIPLCWNISSISDITDRWRFVVKHFKIILIAPVAFIVVASLQLIYWKYATGNWLVYSYQNEGFSWLHPHIKAYTFSYRCGWLLYCPMMILPFVGIMPYLWARKNLLAILGVFALNFYIVTAWDIWDYGGTAGRAMVQSYPVLAFPLATLIESINNKTYLKLIFYPIFTLFIYLNIWWLYNVHGGKVQVNEIPKAYYWAVVGRWSVDEFDTKLLDGEYTYRGYPSTYDVIYENNFENDTSSNVLKEENNISIVLNANKQFTTEYTINKPTQIKQWLRLSADFTCLLKEWNIWQQTQFKLAFYNNNTEVQSSIIKPHRFLNNGEHKNLFLDTKVPTKDWNKLGISAWNADGKETLIIDNLKLITFNEQ